MPQTSPVGFLDLPLELRQMIYGHILPADRIMNFPASQERLEEEGTVVAVSATDPQIEEELVDLLFKECNARILVTPHCETGIPSAVEWNRFQRIRIKIGHYEDHSGPYRWGGMRELIKCLCYGDPKLLPDITILFHEDDTDESSTSSGGDFKWTEDILGGKTYHGHGPSTDCTCGDNPCYSPYQDALRDHLEYYDGSEDGFDDDREYENLRRYEAVQRVSPYDAWLRTTGDCYGNPVAIEILDYFLELPPCKSAVVHCLRGLDERSVDSPLHDPKARIFDELYTTDLCAALELWLAGERDGIKLPVGLSNRYGEPRLEQLAYQKHSGRYYCDRGLGARELRDRDVLCS